MLSKKLAARRGALLLLTVLVTLAIVFFAIYITGLFRSEKVLSSEAENDLVAEAAANAGINDAIYQIKRNSLWTTGFSATALPTNLATYTVTFTSGAPFVSTNNSAGSTAVTGYNGRVVPAGKIHLVSRGTFNKITRTEEAMVSISTATPGSFVNALSATGATVMSGAAVMDSFTSTAVKGVIQTYAATKALKGANVQTTLSAAGSVNLSGSAMINGIVTVPSAGSSATITKSGTANDLGFTVAPTVTTPLPFAAPTPTSLGTINMTSGTLAAKPGSYTGLTMSGGTLTLSSGTYVINGSLSINSAALINAPTGPVIIYVTGSIKITGNSQITTPQARDLLIYGVGAPTPAPAGGVPTPQTVLMGDSGTGTFVLYAPTYTTTIQGNAQVYGSVTAGITNVLNSGAIHYDSDLLTFAVDKNGNPTTSSGTGGVVSLTARW